MRRAIGILIGLALVAGAVLLVVKGSDGESGYKVRAIFDDIAGAVPGEDVRVAGARVGKIDSLDVTPEKKAAMILTIEDSGFQPFHADARCTVRPQSLIGEKFVECTPGSPSEPELGKVPEGNAGAGQYLLPLGQTSSPVDLDLINNTMRLPFRQRFSLILNELGAGFAGRGEDLNALIHRANPALRETDEVLKQLAAENQTLKSLARQSDIALAPLARERERLSGFITKANAVGEATAERREDIEASIQKLPRFLEELSPTMRDLGVLSDEMLPVITDLGDSAPDLANFVLQLGPFSTASTKAIDSLGDATDVGGPVLQRAQPVIQDLRAFANDADPVSKNLDDLTASLDKSGGIERLMDYIFFQMTAINGFDALSHYLRAGLLVNLCSTFAVEKSPGCSANFSETEVVRAQASGNRDQVLAAQQAAYPGAKQQAGTFKAKAGERSPTEALGGMLRGLLQLSNPAVTKQREAAIKRIRENAKRGVSPALARTGGDSQQLLEYLMGDDR